VTERFIAGLIEFNVLFFRTTFHARQSLLQYRLSGFFISRNPESAEFQIWCRQIVKSGKANWKYKQRINN